jgi:hypothetical protein
MYTNQQLRDWATQAANHYRQELDLFGYANEDFTLTPAMVRSVLTVVERGDSQPPAAAAAAPVLVPVAARPQPQLQPGRIAQGMKAADRIKSGMPIVIQFLKNIAVNGEMPTRGAYDAQRGDLPSSSTLYKTGGIIWADLAEQIGLKLNTRAETMYRTMHVARHKEADAAEPASQFPQPLSDHARSVLGPEHIAVTPYRNGNERH